MDPGRPLNLVLVTYSQLIEDASVIENKKKKDVFNVTTLGKRTYKKDH